MDDKLEEDIYRENLKLASFGVRIGAYLIDLLLLILFINIMFSQSQKEKIIAAQLIIIDVYSSDHREMNFNDNVDNSKILQDLRNKIKEAVDVLFLYIFIYTGLQIIYNFIFLYFYGATLGQIVLKIKVIDKDNFDKPTLHVCMKRAILKCILGTTFYVSFIFALTDKFCRTLHDRLSKTIVIAN